MHEVEGGEHHVAGVQGVDEVGREPVPLLHVQHFHIAEIIKKYFTDILDYHYLSKI